MADIVPAEGLPQDASPTPSVPNPSVPDSSRRFSFLVLAIQDIGLCLDTIGRLILQGPTRWEDAHAARAGVAAGLNRAIAHVQGLPYNPPVDEAQPQNQGNMHRE